MTTSSACPQPTPDTWIDVTYDAPRSCWRPLMLHELSAAVLVVVALLDPPPQPATRAAETATTRPARGRFTAAPVYSSQILRRVIAGGVVTAWLLGGVLAQSNASPAAHASSFAPCDISGKQQQLGASYVTSLKVQGVSCAKAEKLIRGYHRCRHDSGGASG